MFRMLATSSAALIAAAAPAFAEITPAQLWDHIVQQYEQQNFKVTTGSQDEAGDTLTITDAVMSNETDEVSFSITFPKIVMNQTGDGNVRWTVEGDMTGQGRPLDTDHGEGADFVLSMPGNETVSSGTPEEMTHESTAESAKLVVNLPEYLEDDEGEEWDIDPIEVTIQDVSWVQSSKTTDDDSNEIDISFNGGALAASAKAVQVAQEGAGGEGLSLDYTMESLSFTGKIHSPDIGFDDEIEMQEAMKLGAAMDFAFDLGPNQSNFEFSASDAPGQVDTTSGSSAGGATSLKMAVSADGFEYSGVGEFAEATYNMSFLPFPVSYSVGETSFELKGPILTEGEAEPFKALLTMKDLVLDDAIWGLFDPQGKLPRDPASMTVDITGNMEMPEGTFDAPDYAAEVPESPVEPIFHDVTINTVALDVAGAQVEVTGELAGPDGKALNDLAGDQVPVGHIDAKMVGLNTLMTSLGEMGLMPADQLMGARMGLAMFSKPIEGQEDALETKLEFNEDGSIFANGQQVK